MKKGKRQWQDWIVLILGLWVLISPLFFLHEIDNTVMGTGAWNLFLAGLILSIVATDALIRLSAWEEWTILAVGVWLLISPWVIGFSSKKGLFQNAVIVGTIVVLLSLSTLIRTPMFRGASLFRSARRRQ